MFPPNSPKVCHAVGCHGLLPCSPFGATRPVSCSDRKSLAGTQWARLCFWLDGGLRLSAPPTARAAALPSCNSVYSAGSVQGTTAGHSRLQVKGP